MSRPAQIGAGATATAWTIGQATRADATGVVVAVQELLLELGGTPPPTPALRQTTLELIDDEDAGAVLVARLEREVIGVLAASWQLAIHTAGRYATIQDLWVHSAWRSRSIGAELLDSFVALAREREMTRIEVGLPRESFGGLRATEAFYLENGFAPLGPRMRLVLS